MSQTIDVESSQQALAIRPEQQAGAVQRTETFADLMRLAESLVTTGFLPAAVKTPAQATAIILTGRELGLGPMQSLRSICIIQGKPELAADLQLSIFKSRGGKAKWLALDNTRAQLHLRHPNGDEHTETFSMQDAQAAGLAHGQNWQKYPKAMLRSRAITAGLKSLGFEPLAGCYAPGEIGGPEIVPTEYDTPRGENPQTPQNGVADPKITSPVAPGRAQTSAPVSAHPPQTTPAPKAAALKPATAATRNWMLKQLEPIADLALEYFRKLESPAVLLPNEQLKDVPLRFVPITTAQLKALIEKITDFGNGAEVTHAFPGNPDPEPEVTKARARKQPAAARKQPAAAKPIEIPRDANPDPDSPDAPWRSFPMPFGNDAGAPLADMPKNKLYGWWANYQVETTYNGKPKRPETIAKDTKFREMLDEAGKHYKFTLKEQPELAGVGETPADLRNDALSDAALDDDVPF